MNISLKTGKQEDTLTITLRGTNIQEMDFVRKEIGKLIDKPKKCEQLDDFEAFHQECRLMTAKYGVTVHVNGNQVSGQNRNVREMKKILDEWKGN